MLPEGDFAISCGRAVDERAAGLTQVVPLIEGHSGCGARSVGAFRLELNHPFNQEYHDGHLCCRPQGRACDNDLQKTSSRPSSSASNGWKKRRRPSPTISATSMPEAKGNGYDVKALRTVVRLRKQDANERAEQETILETYMQALGML